METIHKYRLEPSSSTCEETFDLPIDAKVLCVKSTVVNNLSTAHIDENQLFMWVQLDAEKPKVKRTFVVYGTGWEIEHPENIKYVGTCFTENEYVWHIYEKRR
jgi:hypothetical protein